MHLVEEPDEVVVHKPAQCEGCGQSLAAVPAVRRERRQVVDIPPVKARVVEHQVETKCGPRHGLETSGQFPEGVEAPAQYGPGVATRAVYLNMDVDQRNRGTRPMVCVLTSKELRSLRQLAQRLERRGLVAESRALRNILGVSGERREVRASTAARILHVTPQTVRNWVKRGLLRGRIDETGHVFVAVDALSPTVELDAAMPYPPDSAADVSVDEILEEIEAHRAEQRTSPQRQGQG